MLLVSDKEGKIKKDWSHNPQVSELCLLILHYVYSGRVSIKCITINTLKIVSGNRFSIKHMLLATQYLSGPRAKVLDVEFEFIDDDDNIFKVSRRELAEAYKNNEYVHPITGEVLYKQEFESRIYEYFVPSKYLVENYV